jgi:hypothetical protein
MAGVKSAQPSVLPSHLDGWPLCPTDTKACAVAQSPRPPLRTEIVPQ